MIGAKPTPPSWPASRTAASPGRIAKPDSVLVRCEHERANDALQDPASFERAIVGDEACAWRIQSSSRIFPIHGF
jgi:hypothetical protein